VSFHFRAFVGASVDELARAQTIEKTRLRSARNRRKRDGFVLLRPCFAVSERSSGVSGRDKINNAYK
jgi:hypothetical protein